MIEFHSLPSWFAVRAEDLRDWLHSVAEAHQVRISKLSYQFLKNSEIEAANRSYLNHDYATDIITFGYEEGDTVEGEILIGEEVVVENASEYGVAAREEMCRVVAHGLLHLIGFNDSNEEERQRMRKEEDKALILRPKNLKES